jgi:SpoIID/LytB domain protein
MAAVLLATYAVGTHAQDTAANRTPDGATIENIDAERLLIRLREQLGAVSLSSGGSIRVKSGPYESQLPAGSWKIQLNESTPQKFGYRVIVKGLKPDEFDEAPDHIRKWKAEGYDPETMMLGHRLRLASGGTIDARVLWISLAVLDTDLKAQTLRNELEAEGTWAWQRKELTSPGSGEGVLSSSALAKAYALTFPLTISSDEPITLTKQKEYEARSYTGDLLFGIGGDGAITITERIGIADYLAGVLPSEMPALWPVDALKAQAVAARSDVLAHMRVKHFLSGYHFSDTVRDRAYKGAGGRHPGADAAVIATRGEVLSDGTRLLPGVFSATCGGWTEDNETVWFAPGDAALRGRSDMPDAGPSPTNIRKWLKSTPAAYCDYDAKYFRWKRRISRAEATKMVNQEHTVGTVQRIELGDRGDSGRLKWIRIHGIKGEATIKKELPIRQLFGSLPSAMFIIDEGKGADGQMEFIFTGGGRGHGVGLCQYGARGMADAGHQYGEILSHYYAGSTIAKVK